MNEVSCGAIIFVKNKEVKYLLLNYPAGHWDFVKGHIEKDEKEEQTVIRETKEETGIEDVKFIPDFREKVSYFFKRNKQLIHKDVIYYLLETKTKEIKLTEHNDFKWLNFEEAFKKLTFENSKQILQKANRFLENGNK